MEELNFEEQYIRLSITNDGEGNPLCSIKLDDEQELVITAFELEGLRKILSKNGKKIKNYCNKILNEGYGVGV
jgi:hypothetical protein